MASVLASGLSLARSRQYLRTLSGSRQSTGLSTTRRPCWGTRFSGHVSHAAFGFLHTTPSRSNSMHHVRMYCGGMKCLHTPQVARVTRPSNPKGHGLFGYPSPQGMGYPQTF